MKPYRTPNMSDEEWERQQYIASFGDTFSDPEELRRRNEAIAKWKPGTPVFGGEKETREPGRGGLGSLLDPTEDPNRSRFDFFGDPNFVPEGWPPTGGPNLGTGNGTILGGLSNLFSGMPEGYEEMIMAQRKEKEDLFSSYGKDPQDPSAHPMSGGRFTKEFMDYAKSKGYDIKDMTPVDGGMHLTKKEWDTEKKQKFPQFHTFLGEPGVMPISKPLMPDIDKWMPEYPDEPIPPRPPSVMPTPQPPVMEPPPPIASPPPPDIKPLLPPELLPDKTPEYSGQPRPTLINPILPGPLQLPTGQQSSGLTYSRGAAVKPPSLRLKHGGSLTNKVSHLLRILS